jgi:hypothetical protein
MPVLTRERRREIIDKLPTVKYPDEVLQRLDREYREAKAQMASGELKPMSVEEFAEEYGITLDDED